MYNNNGNNDNMTSFNMEKKFKLTDEILVVNGKTLYRIKALKDFSDVKKGEKGGFVEKEINLSQYGDCWVYGNAMVYDNAKIYGDAVVGDNAKVWMDAKVSGNAKVYYNAQVYGNAEVYGHATILHDAEVYDKALVFGNAEIFGDAKVFGYAKVLDFAEVYDDAEVYGYAKVYDTAKVYDDAQVYGDAAVCGETRICDDAKVESNGDYILFKNWWSSGRFFTWTKSNNMWKVGCFYGTGKELVEKAYKDSEISGREYERVVKYVEAIMGE